MDNMNAQRWTYRVATLLALTASLSAQANTVVHKKPNTLEEMQALLLETAKNYREAKSLNIQRQMEANVRSDMSQSWSKSFSSVSAAPGNRYRREDKNEGSWEIHQSDGTNEWRWYPWRKQYWEEPVDKSTGAMPSPPDAGWLGWLKEIDKKLAAGKLQPPETIEVGGKPVDCMVIVGLPPVKEWSDPSMKRQTTYWVDRDRKVLIREQLTIVSTVPQHPFNFAYTTTYTTVELNPTLPDSLFTFVPPKGVEHIARFESGPVALVGKPAPRLTLKTLDGKDFDLTSLLARPVLLDFWATWCVPCRQSMPGIAKLYEEFHSKGLEVVSVDIAGDPKVAASLIGKNSLSWTQLEDPDMDTAQYWGESAVPRLVLIGKDGKVRFDSDGWDENEETKLRSALHKMDSAFPAPK